MNRFDNLTIVHIISLEALLIISIATGALVVGGVSDISKPSPEIITTLKIN